MNQINDPGNPKDFGHEFNYEQWTANNEFTLCNVPWNSDYRDVHGYETHAQLNSYIDSRESPRVNLQGTRGKINMPVRFEMSLAKAMKYNYLRVRNGLMPIASGDEQNYLYYFVVGLRELNPETTEFILQLDVWSTFRRTITGVRGYVERGHIGVANTKRMQNFGRDYLTVPEGLETGTEYRGVAARNEMVMAPASHNVIALFANDPTAPKYRTVDGAQVPNYTSSRGSIVFGIPTGAMARMWASPGDFRAFMQDNIETPWVTQSIMAIMLVPDMNRYGKDSIFVDYDWHDGAAAPTTPLTERIVDMDFDNWRNDAEYTEHIPERYRHLDKLKTFPYTLIEMTTFGATPIILKPENWPDSGAHVLERANLIPGNARLQFSPRAYGQTSAGGITPKITAGSVGGDFVNDRGGSYWDLFTQITALPTVPIVNDGAILALANQANGLSYAAASADWSQQRALMASQTGYDQASSAMQLGRDQLSIAQQGQAAQNNIQMQGERDRAAVGMLTSLFGGGTMGAMAGPAGMAGGAASGVLGGAASAIQLLMQQASTNGMLESGWATQNAALNSQQGNMAFVRDSNRDLAQFAARGDYENTIAGINARVRDTEMTPASVVGQMGGEMMHLIYRSMGLSLRWKLIDNAAIRVIGEYWLRYGYAVRQFVKLPTTFRCMSKFTYWKLSETYVSGANIPESYRQALRGIFEKGVTVWNNPEDISNADFDIADNTPIAGITLP